MSLPRRTHPSRRAASLLIALCAGLPTLSAQSIWSAGTSTWNTGSNWSPVGVPVSGSSTTLQFNQAATNYNATNDIAGDFQLNRLIFSGTTAGGTTTVSRNGTQSLVFVSNGGTAPEVRFNATGNSRTISIPVVLNADTTVRSDITDTANNLNFNGGLSGAGSFTVDYSTTGTGIVVLTGSASNPSSHAGTQLINGTLAVGSSANAPLGAGPLTLSGGRFFTTSGTANFANSLKLAGNATVFRSTTNLSLNFTNGGSIEGTNATRTLTLGNSANTLTLGGAVTGTGNGLTLAGTGTLALGGGAADASANTFNGTTTISAATLNLNKADGTNAVAGNLEVNGGTLAWARSNQIADTSSLTQNGGTVRLATGISETVQSTVLTNGAFSLAGSSSFTTDSLSITTSAGTRRIGGALTVGAGGLTINHDGTIGSTRNAVTIYDFTAPASAGVINLNGNLTFNNATVSDAKVQITRGDGTGYFDLGGAVRTFTINDGPAVDDLEIATGIQNGGLIKEGAGVLSIINFASTYAGDTTINEGTIRVNNSGQRLSNQSTYRLADAAGATLDINGNSQTIGGLAGGGTNGGTVALGAGTLTIGNNNTSTEFSGAMTGTGGITKTGTGTLTLSSDLEYTGATLVSAGALMVNSQLDSSGITLDGAEATLSGSGRVNGLTLNQGTFSPGNSPGTFTVDGNVSFGAASTFLLEVASASSFDKLVVNGALSTISIDPNATLSVVGLDQLEPLPLGTILIFIDNTSGNPIAGAFAAFAEGHSFLAGDNAFITSYTLGDGGNDFGFTVGVIPEPSFYALLAGLASLGFVANRRRR